MICSWGTTRFTEAIWFPRSLRLRSHTSPKSPASPWSRARHLGEITGGLLHTCAASAGGDILCYGDNSYGQLGNGATGSVGIVPVTGINGTFLAHGVAAGNQFPCGRRGAGTSACWGAGTQGQLGDSASASSTNPVAVTGSTNAF